MGAWEQLDTEVNVELEIDDLDNAIDLISIEEIQSCLKDIKDGIEKGSKEGIQEVAIFNRSFQQNFVTDLSRYPYASGRLGSSIVEEEQDEYTWLIGTQITEIYPMALEYGRKEIRPVRAKALAFYSLTGELVFTKYVRPLPPKPFVAPAYEKTNDIADKLVLQGIENNL